MERKDKILIRGLSARCIIGINPWERRRKQKVLIDISLEIDPSGAAARDDINLAVNYRTTKKEVLTMIQASSFNLLERLAEEIAGACLSRPGVDSVTVTVDKPGALRFARSVGIEITRMDRP